MSEQLARWFVDLCKGIAFHNNEGEMEKLCKGLDIPYDQYPEDISIADISLEIGGSAVFSNKVGKVVEYLQKNRPRVQPFSFQSLNWESIEDQADISLRIGDPLLTYYTGLPLSVPKKGKYKMWYEELAKALTNYYDDDEFRKMCMDLNINYLPLMGLKRPDRASEFVKILIRLNGIKTAVKYCRQNRPRVQPLSNQSIQWDDIVERAMAAFKSGNALNDPILAKRVKKENA